MNSKNPQFEILASHKIVGFPDGNIISWCPQMDLLAVSMNHTSIWVFRLDGERVYSINNRAKILHLQWSRSGKFFVLSGTDNAIKVYDSNNGKLVNQFATSADLPITLVSWASINIPHSISPDGVAAPFMEVSRVEILDGMPKLANEIDTSSVDGMDGIDGSNNDNNNNNNDTPYKSKLVTNTTENNASMDYLLVVSGDSNVSVTFNNLFTISGILLPNLDHKCLKHKMSHDFFKQSFLAHDSSSRLLLQDFEIDVSGPRNRGYFFDTIRWASQLISILNHINDQFNIIKKDSTEFLTLYDRYLSNYKDSLYADIDVMTSFPLPDEIEEKIVVDLGGMLLTGLIPISTKDYWLNQFGERGLMKLSTLGNTVYDNARKLAFTQLILGLEKLIIILSYLESLSKTADVMKEDDYGITLDKVQDAISLAQNLVKKIYAFIWKLNEEHEYFNQFLNWVQVEIIEKLSKEENDSESFFADHPTMDFKVSLIMEYFSDYLFDSVLIKELALDCSMHETLIKKEEPTESVNSIISQLQNAIKSSLTDMENSFAKKVVFKPTVPLDTLSEGKKSDLHIFKRDKLITSVDGNVLTVSRISSNTSKIIITYPNRIICHKLIGEERLVILYLVEDTNHRFDLIEIPSDSKAIQYTELNVLKSHEFGLTSPIKRPAYMTINTIDDKSSSMVLILDESKKEYMVFRI